MEIHTFFLVAHSFFVEMGSAFLLGGIRFKAVNTRSQTTKPNH